MSPRTKMVMWLIAGWLIGSYLLPAGRVTGYFRRGTTGTG
jgi:hypothetical protein